MKKCSLCGENATKWGRNFPCHPTETPAFEDHLPDQPRFSAVARGFSPGDIVRNKYGHVAIITYANHKWCDIRVRMKNKYTHEFPTVAMGWRLVKKASVEQAARWLAEESERSKNDLPHIDRYFRINPITNETIYLQPEDYWNSIYDKSFWNLNKTQNIFKMIKIKDISLYQNKDLLLESKI